MWANLLSAIGRGALSGLKAAGRGIKEGVNALSERLDETGMGEYPMATTPPFIPDTERRRPSYLDAAQDRAFGITPREGGRTTTAPVAPATSPTFPRDYAPFGATPTRPEIARAALLSSSPPPVSPPAGMIPEMDLSGEGVPIPALPGRSGGPQPYSPIAKAKYEHVMKGAASPSGGFRRAFKDIALNAVLGGLQGASRGDLGGLVGGALAGGLGTAINPMMGREYQFETVIRPEMEREEERGRSERRQKYEDAIMQAKVAGLPREAEMEAAKLEQIRVANQVALENAKRQQALAESQIRLNDAKTEAARTGRPQKVDRVNPETGEIETVMIYPNGDEWLVGGSAQAALQGKRLEAQQKIARERNESAERRVGMQQAGATGRTAMAQAGAKERTQMRIDAQGQAGGQAQSKLRKPGAATGKVVSGADADAFAAKKGIDKAQWRAHLQKQGWTIKD